MQDLSTSITGLSPKERLEKFTAATFLARPKLLIKTSIEATRLRNSAAEALFYFHSNQFDKITGQHITDAVALYEAAGEKAKNIFTTSRLLSMREATETHKGGFLPDKLRTLLDNCRHEHFAANLVNLAIKDCVALPSPFSENMATCQESYELDIGLTCLRFIDGQRSFFLFQEISSIDGIFFPLENVAIGLNGSTTSNHPLFLMALLLRQLETAVAYAQTTNLFSGIIASHHRPAHFYYEILPSLVEINQRADLAKSVPQLIVRRNQDFANLDILFSDIPNKVLASEEIAERAFKKNQWFLCAGISRHLRSHQYSVYVADAYLVGTALKHPTPLGRDKAQAVADCYPLVWVGLEGQKRCWLEQVEGYAYILNQLIKDHPKLGVIIDGWTSPLTPTEKSLANIAKDQQVAENLLRRLDPAIRHTVLIGENSNTKLYVGHQADFFICNFSTGSLHISRMLGKPGFCHSNNELAETALRMAAQIHPNPHVYLLPQQFVTDKPDSPRRPPIHASDLKHPKKLFKKLQAYLGLTPVAVNPPNPGSLSYSIDKTAFYAFIRQRLETVLANRQASKLSLFMDIPCTASAGLRLHLKKASHGNLILVFPGQKQIKQLTDLADFDQTFLNRQLIYGQFGFKAHEKLGMEADYLVWLRDPLQRLKLHVGQFAKNQPQADIASLLTKGFKGLDNHYTRILSGQDVPFGRCTEAMLATALDNLARQFVFIGIHEHAAESFDRLCAFMDWDRTLFPEQLADQFQAPEIRFNTSDTLLAEGLIQLDLRLYQAALEMAKNGRHTRFAL